MNPVKHDMFFVAIACPPGINEKVLQFKNRMRDQFGCIVALKSPAHITLIPPFWLDSEREPELLTVLQSFHTRMEEVRINLDGFSHFDKRVLFVNVEDNEKLKALKREAEKHFSQSFGEIIKIDERPFHPHVTIANRDLKPGDFEKAWDFFSHKAFAATFLVTAISLLKLSSGKWIVVKEKELPKSV